MRQSLADITGVATIKTLVASLGVPDFTIDELAQQTGVSRKTVDTVLRRYEHAFERVPAVRQAGRGRPPVRWRLRSEHLDEVVAAVESHQSALSIGLRAEAVGSPDADSAEAALIMAAVAIARTSDDARETAQLVSAARHSLAAAGFGPDGSPWTGQPSQELSGKAHLVASVADVVEACASNDQGRIDKAQAQAMPHVMEAAQYMPASEWLPLAQRVALAPGTVLSAPVLVGKKSVNYFNRLFPSLKALAEQHNVPSGFVCMSDTRAPSLFWSGPATFLLWSKDPDETRQEFAHVVNPFNFVVVSSRPEVLKPVIERGAQFVLQRGSSVTKTEIANVVNWRACGFSQPGGFSALGRFWRESTLLAEEHGRLPYFSSE
jgi:hypothetical protein